jgi:HEAT repeat protein
LADTLKASHQKWLNQVPTDSSKAEEYWQDCYRKLTPLASAPLGEESKKAICEFISHGCKNENSDVRKAAVGALVALAPHIDSEELLKLLTPCLKDKNWRVREAAVRALVAVAPHIDSGELLKLLTPCLKDKNSYVRRGAAHALGALAPHIDSRELLKLLTPCFKDEDSDVRKEAVGALEALAPLIDSGELLKLLTPCLKDEDWRVRKAASGALGALSPPIDSGELLKLLTPCLKDKNSYVRRDAAHALGVLAPHIDSEELLSPLTLFLKDKRWDVRRAAVDELIVLATYIDSGELLKLLTPCLKDKDRDVRKAAARALGALAPHTDSRELLKLLTPCLKDEDWYVRRATADQILQEWSLSTWRKAGRSILSLFYKNQDEQAVQFLAECLLRYSVPLVLPEVAIQWPQYQRFMERLTRQAQASHFPTDGYCARKLKIRDTKDMPKLPSVPGTEPYTTALHQAEEKGDLQAMQKALKDNPHHLNHHFTLQRRTPLLCAASHKQWQSVQWLLKQKGVWIDAIDAKENSLLNYLCLDPAAVAPALFSQTFKARKKNFPTQAIEKAVTFMLGKGCDKHKKAILLSDTAYANFLIAAVAPLVGKRVRDFNTILTRDKALYKHAAQNIMRVEQENRSAQEYTEGGEDANFLRMRSYLLFSLLVALREQGESYRGLPRRLEGQTYPPDALADVVFGELHTVLTTLWDDIARTACFATSLLQLDTYPAWRQGILARLEELPSNSELSLSLAHAGHNIYLSLQKTETHYAVRVDNRWLNTTKSNGYTHPTNPKDEIQPYLVACFPLQDWSSQRPRLQNYLAEAGKLYGQPASQVINHLYRKGHITENLPAFVQAWPYRPQQTTAQNCFMRSHNVGYRIRVGEALYRWLRKRALENSLFERVFIEEQSEEKAPHAGSLQGNNLKGGSVASHHPLPSHQELMKHFATCLNVDYSQVYTGIAVEQTLVGKAGIARRQAGASYRRNTQTTHTDFTLHLSDTESQNFISYYQQHHPSLIQHQHTERIDSRRIKVAMDTRTLDQEVVPILTASVLVAALSLVSKMIK